MQGDKPSVPQEEAPPYEPRVPAWRRGCGHVVVVCYAAVVSAFLLATLLYGGFYLHKTQTSRCEVDVDAVVSVTVPATYTFERHMENFTRDGMHVVEVIDRDVTQEVEVMLYLSDTSANGTVIVVEHKKSLTSLYVPAFKQCFLIAGTNHDLLPRDGKHDKVSPGGRTAVTYTRVGDFPLRDNTLLTDLIRPHCMALPLYWLEKSEHDEDASALKGLMRRKRTTTTHICILWGLISITVVEN